LTAIIATNILGGNQMTTREADRCDVCALGRASKPGPCPFHDLTRRAGSLLAAQGDVPTHVWYLRRGTVLLTATSAAGDETFCALRGPETLIGLEMLRGTPSAYDAWALSDVEGCRLDADSFTHWIGNRGTPMGAILEFSLAEGSRWQRERIALAGRAVARVARFLAERRALDDRPLAVEHRLLARMLGMRAETLSRALGRLRDEGVLEPGREIAIADVEALARIAGDTSGND
jgi:CRP-like cAMP-binding protein